jgi:UDP-GlcNAc:undecaprenyl-phosphate GlcNAc-1-phosphate transferase
MAIQAMVFCWLLGCLISLLIIPLLLLPKLLHSIHARRSGQSGGPSTERPRQVPRLGGFALAVAFVGVLLLIGLLRPVAINGEQGPAVHLVWGAFAISLIGVWDDYRGLGTTKRLLLQALVAAALFSQGVQAEPFHVPVSEPLSVESLCNGFITVLWLISLTSLVQIMDKVAGLAAAVGCTVMGLVALAGYWAGVDFPALCAAGMAGGLVGFLFYNFPPARIRLGGGGSCLIGFLIASLTTQAASEGTVFAGSLTPFLVVTLLTAGAAYAVLRRKLGGTSVFPGGPKPTTPSAPFPQRGVKPQA